MRTCWKRHLLLSMPQMRYCSSNIVKRVFRIYSELISCLLVAEQHNSLLMKNHEAPPTGAAPLLEANMVLQKPYCKRIFKKYYDLIICLLMAEQYNTLLLKNHEARSTRASPLSEANVVGARDQSEVKRDDHRGYYNARERDKDKRR